MRVAKFLIVPALAIGYAQAAEETIDAVAEGKDIFENIGCIECHTVDKGNPAFKTGPNLYGLFLSEPRERKVVINKDGKDKGEEKLVKADREYFNRAMRKSWDELAVAESGPTKGEAYPPVMPSYIEQLVSDDGLDSLWHYMRTLADEDQKGPDKVMVTRVLEEEPTDLLDIAGEIIVTDRTRVIRASIAGVSARSLHVGQPNGMSYTFDPRMLSVRRVWTGGFVNLNEERRGRGGKLSKLGKGAETFIDGVALLTPLTPDGVAVDFEFKEPDAQDYEAIARHISDGKDFTDKLAAVDAEFLGHSVSGPIGLPKFHFRVGKNKLSESIVINDEGYLTIVIHGELKTDQSFQIHAEGLSDLEVSEGKFENGVWTLPAGGNGPFALHAQLSGGANKLNTAELSEDWSPQDLVTEPAKAGRLPLETKAGYSVVDWKSPLDLFGRQQLFEPTGIAVADDGTIVLATRTAGVWRIRDGKWTLFAEGIFEALGVVIEDDKGDVIVIAQKPELTRIRDTDGDGRADDFETVCDDFGFHGNYHEYTHGPVRDADGNYYFLLNLSHAQNKPKASWKAGGKFMGSMGGYRGWACRVTPDGTFEPYALGLRSPAGLGIAPDGRIWYAENQGEYVGSSKVVPLEKGEFYGHMSGLISLPGMSPDAEELDYDLWKDKLRKGAVWLPHGIIANSPGSPVWDETDGKFGPYSSQMFMGDQTLSQLFRVVTEQVDGQDQGAVIPFANGLSSGVMRPVFLPDGSLLLGQTGRGWGARGGNPSGLQQIIYDGTNIPADIHHITVTPTGFKLEFTQPLARDVTEETLQKLVSAKSWYYTNLAGYGSPQHDKRSEEISAVRIGDNGLSVMIDLANFGQGETWVDRLYHVKIDKVPSVFGDASVWKALEGFYTLRAIPGSE